MLTKEEATKLKEAVIAVEKEFAEHYVPRPDANVSRKLEELTTLIESMS